MTNEYIYQQLIAKKIVLAVLVLFKYISFLSKLLKFYLLQFDEKIYAFGKNMII